MTRIRITSGPIVMTAEMNDSQTARKLWAALPIEAKVQCWGDEVYFYTPVRAGAENPQADAPAGTVAYWPPGQALCLFFGQTPYSPVNIVGRLDGDPRGLAGIKDGDKVRVEKDIPAGG